MGNKFTIGLVVIIIVLAVILVLRNNRKVALVIPMSSTPSEVSTTGNPVVIMDTSLGKIELELWPNKAPATVEKFLLLATDNFYAGTHFHRGISNFMIQGGDPLTKTDPTNRAVHGTGGPGYTFADEINDEKLVRGVLAMANSGPHTNGSQFFIITADATPWLDGKHTAFGRVISGLEVVETISNLPTHQDGSDHPVTPPIINSLTIKK